MNRFRHLTRVRSNLNSTKVRTSSPWLMCNHPLSSQAQSNRTIRVENPYTRETHCEVPTVDLEGAKKVKELSMVCRKYL